MSHVRGGLLPNQPPSTPTDPWGSLETEPGHDAPNDTNQSPPFPADPHDWRGHV